MITPAPTLTLAGKPYPLAWGALADFRFRSISPDHRTLGGPAFLTQLLWCAFAGISHPYPTWEYLAPVVADLPKEKFNEADALVASILPSPPAEAEKAPAKDEPEPSDAEKKSDLTATAPSPAAPSA